jgi:hypothetical protein
LVEKSQSWRRARRGWLVVRAIERAPNRARSRSLRAAGQVLLYPAQQFALQALMGVSASHTVDLTKACGAAFLDTMTEDLWQPMDSLEEYCKRTVFNNIRNTC